MGDEDLQQQALIQAMTPNTVAKQRSALLQDQLAQVQALLRAPHPQFNTPSAAAIGGLGNIIRDMRLRGQQETLQEQQNALLGQEAANERAAAVEAAKRRGRLRDPNSAESQLRRAEATKLGIPIDPATTGEQLDEVIPNYQKEYQYDVGSKDKGLDRANALKLKQMEIDAQKERQKVEDAQKLTGLEGELRKELMGSPVAKTAHEVATAYKKVIASSSAGDKSTPADDMALIYQYMKIIDPGSVVREGQAAMAGQTTSVPGEILNMYNKTVNGTLLNPTQRQGLVSSARKAYGAQMGTYRELAKHYREIATTKGVDPSQVDVMEGDIGSAPAAAQPAAGGAVEVLNGKRYHRQADGSYVPEGQ